MKALVKKNCGCVWCDNALRCPVRHVRTFPSHDHPGPGNTCCVTVADPPLVPPTLDFTIRRKGLSELVLEREVWSNEVEGSVVTVVVILLLVCSVTFRQGKCKIIPTWVIVRHCFQLCQEFSFFFFENLCGDEETEGGIAGFMTFFNQSLSLTETPILSIISFSVLRATAASSFFALISLSFEIAYVNIVVTSEMYTTYMKVHSCWGSMV